MNESLYDDATYQNILDRIDRVKADSKGEWGKMTPAQMLAHTSEILEVANGKSLENTPLIAKLLKGMIRRAVVGERPYPKGARTHPQYEQHDEPDFEAQKERLLANLSTFRSQRGEQIVHPLFGKMTEEEKGWANYKHLDHHLEQFGV